MIHLGRKPSAVQIVSALLGRGNPRHPLLAHCSHAQMWAGVIDELQTMQSDKPALMKRNAVLPLLVLLPAISHAKCFELTYTLEGQVLRESGKPAAGALVGVSWLEFGLAAGPAMAIADNNGRYRLSVRFRPGNDIPLSGAACTDRLERINVIAYADDRRSYPTQVTITQLNQELPSIRLSEPAAAPW